MADRPAEVGRRQNVLRRRHGSKFAQLDGAYAPRKHALASAPKGMSDATYLGLTSELRVEEAAELAQLFRTLTLDPMAFAAHPADRSSGSARR